jgi:hypothetical protein
MKRLTTIGLALLALFALGALSASSASAEEEGLLPNATSEGEGGKGTLENSNKEKITCAAVKILSAEFLKESDQHGEAKLHFTGCKAGIVSVNTLGDEKEVILVLVLFLVCLINPINKVYGLLILPIEPSTVHIEVPSVKKLILVKGYVIARNTSPNTGKEFTFSLKGELGKQTEATTCEINNTKFEHNLEAVDDSKTPDFPASEETTFTLKFKEEVKLMP